jgi:GTP-binding protein
MRRAHPHRAGPPKPAVRQPKPAYGSAWRFVKKRFRCEFGGLDFQLQPGGRPVALAPRVRDGKLGPAMAELPIVAIVGRPNVGKSTLFNRFAGWRRAIVEDTPGLTRDRVVEEIEAGGRRLLLVDTAGLDRDGDTGIEAAVQEQARAAVTQSDALVFVVDGQGGLLPEDREIASVLRRAGKPVAVAVNKIDTPGHEPRVGEFHSLGFPLVAGVSAEHGRGAWDLLEALVGGLPATEAEPTPDADLRVALVGRPNAGKSSLLNRVLGAERVIVSEQPGTTRDAIDVLVEREEGRFLFVDTAGLRRAGQRDRPGERASALMALRAVERAEVALVIVDAAEGFGEQDLRILSLVRERGCAAALVLNKWDLVSAADPDVAERLERELDRRLKGASHHPVLRISAKTGRGLKNVFPCLIRLGGAARRKIPTTELNRWLQDAVARHEPAMAQRGDRRRPIKFFYATQTRIRPPTFTLFCTDPRAIQGSYQRFLENRLREAFDLDGVPLRLRLRARRKPK